MTRQELVNVVVVVAFSALCGLIFLVNICGGWQ